MLPLLLLLLLQTKTCSYHDTAPRWPLLWWINITLVATLNISYWNYVLNGAITYILNKNKDNYIRTDVTSNNKTHVHATWWFLSMLFLAVCYILHHQYHPYCCHHCFCHWHYQHHHHYLIISLTIIKLHMVWKHMQLTVPCDNICVIFVFTKVWSRTNTIELKSVSEVWVGITSYKDCLTEVNIQILNQAVR